MGRVHNEFFAMNNLLPTDPAILLSFINTRLRDEGGSLEAVCARLGVDPADVCKTLADAGFEYNASQCRFW